MLTENEKQKLAHGLLHIEAFPEELTVEFTTVKLSEARVVWVNERWFLSRGLDITDKAVRTRLDHWLTEEFAYVVPDGKKTPDFVSSNVKTFYADCYGSSGTARHGGSGRVGTLGSFQVKGIGRTPLACESDRSHSHGLLSLEEALREAVYAEICAREFPHGAVPVIAVVDTGPKDRTANGTQTEPRGLAIRPFAFHPAYMERAVLFKPQGNEQSARRQDVSRVRKMIGHFEGLSDSSVSDKVRLLFGHFAEQIAFALAHRLYPGNYASSNLTVEGALLGFSEFRALPNWCRYIPSNDAHGFGNELPEITEFVSSVCVYFNKYAGSATAPLDAHEHLTFFYEAFNRAWSRELLYLFHLEDAGSKFFRSQVFDVVLRYYRDQQKSEVRLENGQLRKLGWLGASFVAGPSESGREENQVLGGIREAMADLAAENDVDIASIHRYMMATGARLLPERSALVREALTDAINKTLDRDLSQSSSRDSIEHGINELICGNRRHWPNVRRQFIVKGQAVSTRCALLYCVDPRTDLASIWIESVSIDGRVLWWNEWVDEAEVECHRESVDAPGWFGCVPLESFGSNKTMGKRPLVFPSNALWYPDHDSTEPGNVFGCVG